MSTEFLRLLAGVGRDSLWCEEKDIMKKIGMIFVFHLHTRLCLMSYKGCRDRSR